MRRLAGIVMLITEIEERKYPAFCRDVLNVATERNPDRFADYLRRQADMTGKFLPPSVTAYACNYFLDGTARSAHPARRPSMLGTLG